MPTVDAVMRPAFGRPKIMEALELFGVRAAPRQELLQLIQDQAPGRVVGDGMVVDDAPAHAPAAAAGTAPGAKPSTASEGLLAPRLVGRGIHGRRHHLLAMCAVVVSKTSCKDRNHRILRGVIAPHQDFFFCKNHDFSRFLINFSTVVVVKHTHVVDPKRLTHIHSHRDLNSLSLSTESTYLLVPMP